MEKKIYYWISLLFCGIASILCTFLCCRSYYKNKLTKEPDIVPTVTVTDPDSGLAITTETLESGIQNINQLNTAQYFFSTKQDVSNVKTVEEVIPFIHLNYEIPGTQKSFSYKYDGHVNGSIDFSKAKVSKEENKIYIDLPKATATDVVFDSPCEFFEIQNNLLNPINPEDMTISEEILKEIELKNAIEKSLLKDAEKNAETIVKDFLNIFKNELEKYTIIIRFN